MLEAVKEVVSSLFPFILSAYKNPSLFFWNRNTIHSTEGVQQGDPLGPLLFCLTLHPLGLRLRSEFKTLYLDDGTMSDILHDLQLV